jgi:hypothetical protein
MLPDSVLGGNPRLIVGQSDKPIPQLTEASMSTQSPPKVALHWMDAAWVDSGEHHDSVNPATGEVIDFIEFKHIA